MAKLTSNHSLRSASKAALLAAIGAAQAAAQADNFEPISEEAFRQNAAQVFWMAFAVVAASALFVIGLRWYYSWRVEKLRSHLGRLYEIAEHVLVAVDPGDIEQLVVDSALEISDATHCYLLLARGRQMYYASGSDVLPDETFSLESPAAPVICLRNREIIEAPDAAKAAGINKDLARRLERKALLYLPIVVGEDCLGVLEVEDRRKVRRFASEEQDRLRHLANLAGVGVRLRDQRALKEQLHRSEKLAAISELADAIAREFSGAFERIGELSDRSEYAEDGPPESQNSQLDEIFREVVHAGDALDRLLQFTRPREGNVETVDVNVLLAEFANAATRRQEGGSVGVKLELSRETPLIRGDPAHLEQVLVLLGRHAEHFAGLLESPGLKIYSNVTDQSVIVSFVPAGSAQQSIRAAARHDQAIDLDRPGLGLTVCQTLIERAGGTLTIDRDSSLGFRIEVEYPLSRREWDNPHTANPPGAGQDRDRTLSALICEPDDEAEELLTQHLSELNCRVVPVGSAQEAIDLCSQVDFDWVFCALQPRGMSGLKVYERVHHRVERFIFLVDGNGGDGSGSFPGPGRAALQKPFDPDEINSLLSGFWSDAATVPADQ